MFWLVGSEGRGWVRGFLFRGSSRSLGSEGFFKREKRVRRGYWGMYLFREG